MPYPPPIKKPAHSPAKLIDEVRSAAKGLLPGAHFSRHFVPQRLELLHHVVRRPLTSPSGVDMRDSRLRDAGSALDVLLREAGREEAVDEGLSSHVSHDMAFALTIQVLLRLAKAIEVAFTIAI